MNMDEDRKVAVIIGCSLGGSALIFILALVLVCVCSRRATARSVSNVSSISGKVNLSSDTDQLKVRGQRLDKVEWAQPSFMRSGSQLWRTNVALITAPSLAVSTIDRQQVPRHESTASHERQKKLTDRNQQRNQSRVPWYEKTLAKADQFLIHRPVTFHSHSESGENLVNGGHSLDRPYGPTSTSDAIQRIQTQVNHTSISSSESSGNAYVIYGSQTALIPYADVRSSRKERSSANGAVNQAYLSRSTLIIEQPKLSAHEATINRFSRETIDYSSNKPKSVHTLIKRFESNKAPEVMQSKRTGGLYLSPANLALQQNQINYTYKSTENNDYLCPKSSINASVSPSRPPQSVTPVNIHSALSQSDRHPTRPDTPVYNAQRFESSDRWQQQHYHVYANDNNTQQSRPRFVNYINSFSEEKKIQDAFKFLDDMDG